MEEDYQEEHPDGEVDGVVLDIHATVVKLGDKCGQLPGMHALSGCDPVSYPYGKDKKSALKVLMNNDIDALQYVLGEPDIIQGQLKATAGKKEATAFTEAATDRQQPATTCSPSPSPNDALEGSRSVASTSRRS